MAPTLPPAKRRRTSRSPAPESSTLRKTTKSLHNFFPTATEEQRWSSQKFNARHEDSRRDALDDEIIEDDYDSGDELFTKHFPGGTTSDAKLLQAPRSPPRRYPSRKSDNSRKLTSSKSFVLPATAQKHANDVTLDSDRPWAQRFSPSNLDELAVHKKKVADVRNWLDTAFTGRNKSRLLVLRGPAGSGKTTTISLLSKSLGFDILEWRNPSASDFAERSYTSVSAQFDEFLGRSNKFGGLDLDSLGTEEKGTDSPRRILLIEEFPTILSRASSSLAAFRSSFQQYLAAGLSQSKANASNEMISPIVVILSESHLNSSSSVLDNLTVHRLLGPEVYNHPCTTIIDFNIIAPTIMHKALKLVLEKEARYSKRSKVPGQAVLKSISEIGDIRSAISSLEFLCLKGDESGAWGGNLSLRSKKAPRDRGELTSMEKESLKLITQREASLGIFHAVGKIVYNKRDDPSLVPEATQLPPPPDHLRHHARRKISQVAVNDLVDETGTDIQTFISALHENYVLSCGGSSFVDTLNGCIDALSDSDIQCVERRGPGSRAGLRTGSSNFNAGVDSLRQHEISYQVAARGLLFSLPYPVKRSLPSGSGRSNAGDAYKMLFPTSVRLWHESEEIDGLIDLWAARLLNPPANSGNLFSRSTRGEKKWTSAQTNDPAHGQDDSNDLRAVPVTMLSRGEIILHQLPYMAKIMRNDAESASLKKVTSFDVVTSKGGRADPHTDDIFNWHRPDSSQALGQLHGNIVGEGEGKLILSDDDIED